VSIPNLKNLVSQARVKYDAFAGPHRAHLIVNQVCWDAQALGYQAGLFFKPGGTNYNQRSLDVVIFKPVGETYDCLVDAEGKAAPAWERTTPTGLGDVDKWRAPVDPASLVPGAPPVEPPVVEPPPVTQPCDHTEINARLGALEQRMAALVAGGNARHDQTDARLDKLEAAPFVVQGQTGVAWGHSHSVNLGATEIE
jgi:hypothetical protein